MYVREGLCSMRCDNAAAIQIIMMNMVHLRCAGKGGASLVLCACYDCCCRISVDSNISVVQFPYAIPHSTGIYDD